MAPPFGSKIAALLRQGGKAAGPSAAHQPGGVRLAAAVVAICLSGCASYQVGNGTLYAPDVSTVYVPIIESDSFRRDLGERLTEAVIKEIESKTPYKVVGTPDADSVLAARLTGDRKHVTVENQNDDPRAVEISMAAEVTWYNRRAQPLAQPTTIPLPPDLFIPMGQTAALLPEAGQSVASQQQIAIERLAQQIVSTMEQRW